VYAALVGTENHDVSARAVAFLKSCGAPCRAVSVWLGLTRGAGYALTDISDVFSRNAAGLYRNVGALVLTVGDAPLCTRQSLTLVLSGPAHVAGRGAARHARRTAIGAECRRRGRAFRSGRRVAVSRGPGQQRAAVAAQEARLPAGTPTHTA
jgi:hypothetical protein